MAKTGVPLRQGRRTRETVLTDPTCNILVYYYYYCMGWVNSIRHQTKKRTFPSKCTITENLILEGRFGIHRVNLPRIDFASKLALADEIGHSDWGHASLYRPTERESARSSPV